MIKVIALVLALSLQPFNIASVERSVVRLVSDKGSCTAFAISLNTYVTAHHCVGETHSLQIDNIDVRVVRDDPKRELALLICDLCPVRGGLPLAKADAGIGEIVTGIGYGGPITDYPLFETGEVVTTIATFTWLKHPILLTNVNWVAGQSGGPVVNRSGEVVGVIVGGFDESTLMRNFGGSICLRDLKQFLK